MKNYIHKVSVGVALSALILGSSACTSGTEEDNSNLSEGQLSTQAVEVMQGNLTECRVYTDSGLEAKELNASHYEFVYSLGSDLGKIYASDCKEESSGLRYKMTMKPTDGSYLITPMTTLASDYPELFDKFVTISGKSKEILLGDFSEDDNNKTILRLSNLVSLLYSVEGIQTLNTSVNSLSNVDDVYKKAKEIIKEKYPDSDTSSYDALIDSISTSKVDKYFTKVYAKKSVARAVQKLVLNNDVVAALGKVSLAIVDANNTALSDVQIEVEGNIVDEEGKSISKQLSSSSTGIVDFYFKPLNNDNLIKVSVKKDGYLDTGLQIDSVDLNATLSRTIKMVPIALELLPEGVALEQVDVSDKITNGYTNIEVVLKVDNNVTDDTNTTVAKTTVTIPANTQLLDENNNTLTSALKATVVTFSADENASSLDTFPGGFQVRVADVPESNSSDTNITFQSAGFVSVQLKDKEGNKVKHFSGEGVKIAMEVPKGTFNPETNATIKIGDEVPIWYYNEDTGKWGYEEMGKVQDIGKDDVWGVAFKATHLTYFNLDWHRGTVCQTHVDIVNENGDKNIMKGTSVGIKLLYDGYSRSSYVKAKDGYFDINNVPKNLPVTYIVTLRGKEIGRTTETSNHEGKYRYRDWSGRISYTGCNATVTVNSKDIPKPPTPHKVKVIATCSDGSKSVNADHASIYTRGNRWHYAGRTDTNGMLTLTADPNEKMYINFGRGRIVKSYYKFDTYKGQDDNQVVNFLLRDKYCSTVATQSINIAGKTILFTKDGKSDVNVTDVTKPQGDWKRVFYALSRLQLNDMDTNLDLSKQGNLTNTVMAINLRKIGSTNPKDDFNINTVFRGINVNYYSMMPYGSKYDLFIETYDNGDIFVNGKVDNWYERYTLLSNYYTGSWTINPYTLMLRDILANKKFQDMQDKLDKRVQKGGTFELTVIFSDEVPLLHAYAKGKASDILHTSFDDIIHPMCKGRDDCTVKYFKTTINLID